MSTAPPPPPERYTPEHYSLDQGRPRPAYEPRRIACSGCGNALSVKDESSLLVICEYCGSHLELSRDQATVLGKGQAQQWQLPIKLGDSYHHEGVRYEVIARIVYLEDNDPDELTREYYLYHPRRPPFWLSEYHGSYSVSWPSHAMATESPFSKKRGDLLKTFDGREWVVEETGVYTLVHVDGALPWLATIGDTIHYAEASERDGSGNQLEVQASGQEIEYGRGRVIPVAELRRAMARPDLGETRRRPAADAASQRKGHLALIKLAALFLLINVVALLVCLARGSTVLDQQLTAAELTAEQLSAPFEVPEDNDVIKIKVRAGGLDNAWMAVDLALVKGEELVIHTAETDLSYYHGVDGGESWSEGSTTGSTYVEVPEAGTYRLLVHAVSALGETAGAETCSHDLRLRVIEGAVVPYFFVATTVLSVLLLIGAAVAYGKWKQGED